MVSTKVSTRGTPDRLSDLARAEGHQPDTPFFEDGQDLVPGLAPTSDADVQTAIDEWTDAVANQEWPPDVPKH